MKKRLFLLLMAVIMAFALVPKNPIAAEDTMNYDHDYNNDGTNDSWDVSADGDSNNVYAYLTPNGDGTYTLTVDGEGAMEDYWKGFGTKSDGLSQYTEAPWRSASVLSTEQIDDEGTAYDGAYLTGITKIVVEDGVTRIGSSTFSYMRDVTEVEIADSVTSIGDRAFMYNHSLKSIAFPDSVVMDTLAGSNEDEDGELLVGHSPNLKSVTLGRGFTVIPCRAFENTQVTPNSITFADQAGITGIGVQAFYRNAGEQSVQELDLTGFTGLEEIANNAFSFWSIQSLKLPASLEKLGTFNTVTDLSEVNWTDLTSLREIVNNAFSGTDLTSVDLSKTTVTSIGNNAFQNCSQLNTIILPATITTIGTNAFIGIATDSTIEVPEDKFALLSGKYDADATSIIAVGQNTPDSDRTIGLTHNGVTTYYSSLAAAANNAVSGDTLIATGLYNFSDGEIAKVPYGVTISGESLSTYGASYTDGETYTAYCDTLQTALANCSDGDTVTLNEDVSVSANININKDVTIDLNEKTVTSTVWAAPLNVQTGVSCTIKNGTINNSTGICVDTQNNSTVVLSGITLTGSGNSGSTIRVRDNILVLDGVTMVGQKLYTVVTEGSNTPSVFFSGTNSIDSALIDGNGNYSLYFDDDNKNIVSDNKSNAICYFLNCDFAELTSLAPVQKAGQVLTWNNNSEGSGEAVTNPSVNNTYYANWTTCSHTSFNYTAANNTLTQTCPDCGHTAIATISAPTGNLTYDGKEKDATVDYSDGWQGAKDLTVTYTKDSQSYSGTPTDAGTYTASISVGEQSASVTYTIAKATPEIGISASANSLTGGGTVTLTVSDLPDGASATVTCSDSSIVISSSGSTFTATLPNSTATYTFTASYNGDTNHEGDSATCEVKVTQQQTTEPENPGSGDEPGSDTPSDYNYPVMVKDSDNGTVTIAKEDQWANDGEKITVTVTPDDAYMLDKLVITDKAGNELKFVDNGDGTYTFTMPKGAVTITATFVEDPNWEEPTEPEEPSEPALPFSDVREGDWFYDVVKYVYNEGLMTGTSAITFEPNTTTTRGMIVSILHRLEGSPVVTGSDYTDVNDSDWYGQAVAWAAENGIVNGFEDSTFRPNAAITREQMAAILYNYADYKGYDVTSRANLDAYSDADQISSWASDVVAWANAEGLINGMTANTLEPQGNATRAQVAAIFQRFLAE